MTRNQVATLAGACGPQEETTTVVSRTFEGHIKLAVAARDLYVLEFDRVWRVNRETGVVTLLSDSFYLAKGHATSIGRSTPGRRKFTTN